MSVNVYDPINDRLIPVAGATLYGDAPVGSIIAFAGKEINLPEGYLAFNGQTVKRGDYPDLWAFAVANEQVGVDKFFSQGDGSTTFTLADLRETSLKGYGETSRTVGAHVKSGGLGVGEFIDDQLQNFQFNMSSEGPAANSLVYGSDTGGYSDLYSIKRGSVRTGTTTEVKAVGVVWAVKARQTGLPIDLAQQMETYVAQLLAPVNVEGVIVVAGSNWMNLAVMKSGKVVTVNAFLGTIASNINPDGIILRNLPLAASSVTKDFLAKDWDNNIVYNIYIPADGTLRTRQAIPQGISLFFGITYISQ